MIVKKVYEEPFISVVGFREDVLLVSGETDGDMTQGDFYNGAWNGGDWQ